MRVLFFIAVLFLIVSCGEKPQPNQDLLSAYELLKKGEFEKAQTLADSAEVLTEADSALYCIVSGAIAVCNV